MLTTPADTLKARRLMVIGLVISVLVTVLSTVPWTE